MRAVLFFILLMAVYQAVKVVFRSALSAYRGGEPRAPRIPGEEMVQDPQCRTYVVKGRALARRIGGKTTYFCSADCADAYERDHRPS
jgi:YHS domain-containing protein